MEAKEFGFKGFILNGFLMLFIVILLFAASIYCLTKSMAVGGWAIMLGIAGLLCFLVSLRGFFALEPNESLVMVFFGKYKGTFRETGFYWVNPFLSKKKLSLRARNLDIEPIKVNDKIGNPVMIGLVMVWRLKDCYKAMFEIDSQTMASPGIGTTKGYSFSNEVANRMTAFENFVMIQGNAALRQVAGKYAYDDNDAEVNEQTLRSSGDEVNEELVRELNARLAMAGIEVIEARINYLAYAPEIAAVMLRRQQATAIIAAREKIVEGAVSMVKLALDKLATDEIVELDEEKKAAMVSNLLVVLCADEAAQPVLNTGTLNH